MKTSNVAEALNFCIRNKFPVLMVGAPGVGKTDLAEQATKQTGVDVIYQSLKPAANEEGSQDDQPLIRLPNAEDPYADLLVSHPAVEDPTVVAGLPWPAKSKKTATFLPFGILARALSATRPTVWFIDDLGQAPPAVQAAYMQLLLARRVNEHVLPDCVTFVAATNGRNHQANVQGILAPVKSRFVTIINVEVDLDAWCVWAYKNDLPPMIPEFLRYRSELLHKFEAKADMENFPCPRTWHFVGKMLNAGVPSHLAEEMFAGAVGKGAAGEFVAFMKTYQSLVNIDAILLDPDQTRLPEKGKLDEFSAMGWALAQRADVRNFGRIVRYAERMRKAGHGDWSVVLMRDCSRKCPAITNTSEWTKMVVSDLGKMFNAAA